ncbi:transcription elongation factor GreA [Fibrobacter sp. UWP2]|uniref:transcription elongation factor GreA n=1 Tax=Fibrobacter sp. UWP2 TaxID=1896216 RepID=UPI0009232B7B|nr:transcription elongation factor GreA [Fibrobacter sp. UWP2]SHJ42584.1 transcription elongation factor GreA [Fibrobacter sp. UWP2]
MEKIKFTQEAYDKLVKDLENLKNMERPRVLQELVDARAQGDLSENAEYHAAKERLSSIDNIEMPRLQDQLARAEVVAFDPNCEKISFGAKVSLLNLKTKKNVNYQLVSPEEADALNGKISFKSPIGAALTGKKKGETIEVTTPRGVNKFQIVDFS